MEPAQIMSELSLPSLGIGLTYDGESLWTGLDQEGSAIRLDPKSGKELANIALGDGSAPSGLAWTAAGEAPALWLAQKNTAEILELDPTTGEERRRIQPIDSGRITGLCTDGAAGPTIWFLYSEGEGETATTRAGRFDSRDGELHKKIVVSPDATGLEWDGRWLWHARTEAQRLCRIDPMFADITYSLDLDFSPAAIAFDGTSLWATDSKAPRLLQIAHPAR